MNVAQQFLAALAGTGASTPATFLSATCYVLAFGACDGEYVW
jgi:hypothetical protein